MATDLLLPNGGTILADPNYVVGGSEQAGVTVFSGLAPVAGQASFDTGVVSNANYSRLEMILHGRSDNADIYDFALTRFNADSTIANYHHAAQGSNPISANGGFFSARWDSFQWFNGVKGAAIPVGGALTGYVAGANAEASYVAGYRAVLFDPGKVRIPHSFEATTRYMEAKTQAHAAADNGPEIITVAGFWTPAAAQAINRIQVLPGLGTKFIQGTTLKILGFR